MTSSLLKTLGFTMKFTTRCFIRKNSKELQKKLADIGYSICRCANFTNAEWINTLPINGTIHGKGFFYVDMGNADCWTVEKELSRFVSENPSYIDCGTNEELFLAIAALRDDSDIHQWFTDGILWELCGVDEVSYYGWKNVYKSVFHKATVEELIEHFTK